MELLWPFRYWTLGMSKRHTVTLHYIFTVYIDKFHLLDDVMQALSKKKTQRKEDLYFAVKCAGQKLSKYFSEVTATTGLLHISAHMLQPFPKLRLFSKWAKGRDYNPEDEGSYTMQYQEAFLNLVENKYCAKQLRLSVNKPKREATNNHFSTTASGCGQSSLDPYDVSSDDNEYLTPKNRAEMTPRCSDRAAR
jgi:hypothetical protein